MNSIRVCLDVDQSLPDNTVVLSREYADWFANTDSNSFVLTRYPMECSKGVVVLDNISVNMDLLVGKISMNLMVKTAGDYTIDVYNITSISNVNTKSGECTL